MSSSYLAEMRFGSLLNSVLSRGRARDREPAVEMDCPEDLRVVADPDRLGWSPRWPSTATFTVMPCFRSSDNDRPCRWLLMNA